jgi:hypothetical protein
MLDDILAAIALAVLAIGGTITLRLSKSPDRFELELRTGTRPKRRKPRLPPSGRRSRRHRDGNRSRLEGARERPAFGRLAVERQLDSLSDVRERFLSGATLRGAARDDRAGRYDHAVLTIEQEHRERARVFHVSKRTRQSAKRKDQAAVTGYR